jgi:hypothetical protein
MTIGTNLNVNRQHFLNVIQLIFVHLASTFGWVRTNKRPTLSVFAWFGASNIEAR